jgi:Lrp/AsnC family transcriptional regulator for asnA, asnC and gidA
MPTKYKPDLTDVKILNHLALDAQMQYADLGTKVHASPATVHVRVKKLKREGIIKNAQTNIDYARLGYDLSSFIGIYLMQSDMYDTVVKELKKINEVVSCHYTTGNYSLLIKIMCRDTEHLRRTLHDRIQKIKGISRTETMIILEESINRVLKLE